MIWCWIFGHNYTSPNWGTELVRGTNPFCYRCGKPPMDVIDIVQEMISMMREFNDRIDKLEKHEQAKTK